MQSKSLEILQKYWGYPKFREPQEDIINSVLAGKDTLALLPTGGGKSICFQVPSIQMEGICLVISPLIALMKDQVYNLRKRGIKAEAIFSGMDYREIDRTFDNCIHGDIKLLYLSPERLQTDLAKARIQQMKVNLLAVDEAHCISQWGYDFRPAYLAISEIRENMPKVPVLGLTATATPEVIGDIQDKLLYKEKNVIQKSFQRKNLVYVVLPEENKREKLLDIAGKVKGSGIVYVRSRKATQDIARFLNANKISVDFYHAGLNAEQRSTRQDAWISGKTRIMVCTNAFGMGIDKPDVRSVVHMDLPDSLEAYFQEAGRGGRDGKVSYAVLLYSEEDKRSLERSFQLSFPPIKEIRKIYRALGSFLQLAVGAGQGKSYDFDLAAFCRNYKLEPYATYSSLKILEKEGWITLTESFYLPSSFCVLISRDELYDFQLKNPSLDLVIKTLLRVSESAFFHYSNINEKSVAKFLKIPEADLIRALEHLQREGIISYRPQKETPQLIFTTDRVEADQLTIDLDLYNFLKERQKQRIDRAIEYANSSVCRSVQLLRYFGEESEPCGACDVCLGRTDTGLSTSDFERYKTKIQQLLTRDKLTEKQIAESFSSDRRPKVIAALSYLIDEGIVVKEKDTLKWNE